MDVITLGEKRDGQAMNLADAKEKAKVFRQLDNSLYRKTTPITEVVRLTNQYGQKEG